MKSISLRSFRRAAALVPAFGLLLAPLAAQSREREDPNRDRAGEFNVEEGVGGRAGIIEEFNFGPLGTDIMLNREDRRDEGGTRLLSGRVVEIRGRTLYVERQGVVVPLDMSALRIKKQPKVGQEVIAEYQVSRTQNVALSLAGEVPPPAVE
ncbi:hypothetical protein [Hyalangium sp.]|uniref:hypothetical protein n=1 Tax=Hyalangium sp. TaxID=2028555 RepID=UPI002D303005|nr:hypothetical protein [Hyalangium sp.]HYH99866.1 hypothetical protein [Hyalangium sp.]